MCADSYNVPKSNLNNGREYINSKINKLHEQDRLIKIFLGKGVSIADRIKCWIFNEAPIFSSKSWKERLIQQADIIRYRTTNKSKLLTCRMDIPINQDQPLSSDDQPLQNNIDKAKVQAVKDRTLECGRLCKLYENKIIGRDKFKSTDTKVKFIAHLNKHLDEVEELLFQSNPENKNTQKSNYAKFPFRPKNFRKILTRTVEEVEKEETGYETSYRWNIAISGDSGAGHPMVLRFIKKQDAVVILLFDPINTVDTVRFVIDNKDSISQLQYKDFFPTRFQRLVYNLDNKDNEISVSKQRLQLIGDVQEKIPKEKKHLKRKK